MNQKEVGEIRRRMRRDRTNMTTIYGCYVNDAHEIVTQFQLPFGKLPENEADKYMSLMKKTLSGKLGKNLINLSFPTATLSVGCLQHARLMTLRKDALHNEDKLTELYNAVIANAEIEGQYLILIGCDSYDVPFKSKDDAVQPDAGEEVFTYLSCAICPVKQSKPNLHYVADEKAFHDGGMLQFVNAPAIGFMFPAFDDRATNIYGAMLYSKDASTSHGGLLDAVFGLEAITAAAEQKTAFEAALTASLGEECSIDIIQQIHEKTAERIQLHKESKEPNELMVDRNGIERIMTESGVSCEATNAFGDAFEDAFGAGAEIRLENMVEAKKYEVRTSDAVVRIAPEKSSNVEIRKIGGLNYITILVDGDVEVNGVAVSLPEA